VLKDSSLIYAFVLVISIAMARVRCFDSGDSLSFLIRISLLTLSNAFSKSMNRTKCSSLCWMGTCLLHSWLTLYLMMEQWLSRSMMLLSVLSPALNPLCSSVMSPLVSDFCSWRQA